jgi:mannose-6-phosphate isomerase-like protein (cupin superfamily)
MSAASVPTGIEAVRVIVGGDETDGHLGLAEETLSADFDGPPLHVHPSFDELFFVLEGELTFQVGDELTTAGAGDWLLARRGVAHTFANHGGKAARALVAVTPAGFERFFRLAEAALAGTEPPEEALGPRPATEIVGPPIPRNVQPKGAQYDD